MEQLRAITKMNFSSQVEMEMKRMKKVKWNNLRGRKKTRKMNVLEVNSGKNIEEYTVVDLFNIAKSNEV